MYAQVYGRQCETMQTKACSKLAAENTPAYVTFGAREARSVPASCVSACSPQSSSLKPTTKNTVASLQTEPGARVA